MGTVAVVPVDERGRAEALAASGTAVVIVGLDSAEVGRLVAALRSAGARAAGFVSAPGDPGAVEMARELFPGDDLTA